MLKTWFKVCQKTFEPLSNFWIKWQTLAGDYSFWLMISSVIHQFRKKIIEMISFENVWQYDINIFQW